MARSFIMTISTITVISKHNSQLIATGVRVVLVCASESYTLLFAVSVRQHL
jgi:hypothetical protein